MLKSSSLWRPLRQRVALTHAKQHLRNDFEQMRIFHSLGISQELHNQLINSGLHQPTAVQTLAIPHILDRKDVVVGAETGGGKTLAYLIPLLEQLRSLPHPVAHNHRPVALIMTTSQELVRQIMSVVRDIDPEVARFTTTLSSTNQSLSNRSVALLIATPKALLRATKPSDFAFTEHIIVDEADMLLTGGFERDTKQILATIRNQPLKKADGNNLTKLLREGQDKNPNDFTSEDLSTMRRQTVFSAATIPDYGKRSVRDFLDYKFPDAVFAMTKYFHRTLPGIVVENYHLEAFVAQTGTSTTEKSELANEYHRMELLWSVLSKDMSSVREAGDKTTSTNTLIFANSIESAGALYEYLTNEKGLDRTNCVLYHKEVAREERRNILRQLQDSNRSQPLVVVCTDIAARGLDTTTVRHVIQYEFANDVVSYIHRIGRTARAGTTGRVSNLVSNENELVFDKIQEAGSLSLRSAFSRKRSLRKKVKKAQRDTSVFRNPR